MADAQRLEAFFDQVPHAVMFFDARQQLLDWNAATESLFRDLRLEVTNLKGLRIQAIFSGHALEIVEREFAEVLKEQVSSTTVEVWLPENDGPHRFEIMLFPTPGAVCIAAFDVTRQRQTEAALSARKHEHQTDIGLMGVVLDGQEKERARIAADLHDGINPLLSLARLNVEGALESGNVADGVTQNKLKAASEILERSQKEIRAITRNLMPAVLLDFGLVRALENLCKDINASGKMKVSLIVHAMDQRLTPSKEVALFRIAQELLNNAIRHGKAKHAELQLVRHIGSIVLMVTDDGVGFEEPVDEILSNGHGIRNIKTRVKSQSGQLQIDSGVGVGSTVTVEIPLDHAS